MATPGALRVLGENGEGPALYLERHQTGDWGVLSIADGNANERALETGARIVSNYVLPDKRRVWVITEAVGDDGRRSHTTLLLPEEY
jgi:hypothetical protein